MADYNSGLPVRTEADGLDERVQSKIVGNATGTSTGVSNHLAIDNDKNAHVEMHGNDPLGLDEVLRLSEIGAITPDGVYDATNNTKPGNVGLIASSRNATPSDTTQTQRLTSVTNGTKRLLDIALHDGAGDTFSASNPLPVSLSSSNAGTEINDYNTAAALAAAGVSNHDYTVTALKTLLLSQVWASASGKLKIDVQIETGVATGVFTTKFTGFNSTSDPNIPLDLSQPISIAAGVRVRVIRRNNDNQAQDVYSTICGSEV